VTITAATIAATILLLTLAALHALATATSLPPAPAAPERQYLAGRLDGARIAGIAGYEDGLLINFAARPGHGQLAGPFRVTGGQYAHARARRWHTAGTPLHAYLSADGAIALVDPHLGGRVPCEPAGILT
jgi:hypothetical protein